MVGARKQRTWVTGSIALVLASESARSFLRSSGMTADPLEALNYTGGEGVR